MTKEFYDTEREEVRRSKSQIVRHQVNIMLEERRKKLEEQRIIAEAKKKEQDRLAYFRAERNKRLARLKRANAAPEIN